MNTSNQIANFSLEKALLEVGAVLLRPDNPFTWASGWKSPIYCDNRKLLSAPNARRGIAAALAERTRKLYPDAEVIVGVATGAIAWGLLAAEQLDLPFAYVRSKAKDHGTASAIEGAPVSGRRVVVVEDLVSTGSSSLAAVDTLRSAGAEVLGMLALFSYRFTQADENFKNASVRLDTLTNYPSMLKAALEQGIIEETDLALLSSWRESPQTWGQTLK